MRLTKVYIVITWPAVCCAVERGLHRAGRCSLVQCGGNLVGPAGEDSAQERRPARRLASTQTRHRQPPRHRVDAAAARITCSFLTSQSICCWNLETIHSSEAAVCRHWRSEWKWKHRREYLPHTPWISLNHSCKVPVRYFSQAV